MRGISPVIATVLLLLMSVGAIGGAWIWYQRMQASAQQGGESGIESIKKGAYASLVYIDSAYISGSDLKLDVVNQADRAIEFTKIQFRASPTGSYTDCSTTQSSLAPNTITTITCTNGATGLESGDSLYVKFFFKGAVTKEIGTVIE